jgi:hypothetical protein
MNEHDKRREVDLLIEVGHPSRPDREELMREHIERIKARVESEVRQQIAERLETWAAVRDRSDDWRDGMEEAAAMVREADQ